MGGLTVRAAIARTLPGESLLYFGDGKNVPYGPRSQDEIVGFVDQAVRRLLERDAKMVVVACNAATGAAIEHLRARYDVPIIGMEPAIKPAALTSRTGVVGVLATAAAFKGELYRATSERFRGRVRIIERVGEGFVELVESDLEDTPEAFETVRRVVMPMLEAGADRIVLGCTHYPYLTGQIRRVIAEAGRANSRIGTESAERSHTVEIIDSAPAIARRVEHLLTQHDLRADPGQKPHHDFMTAADGVYRAHLIRKSEK